MYQLPSFSSFNESKNVDCRNIDRLKMENNCLQLYNITVNDIGNVEVVWKNRKGLKLEQSFHYYEGAEGNNEVFENRSSGAYIFRPKSPIARDVHHAISKNFYKGIKFHSVLFPFKQKSSSKHPSTKVLTNFSKRYIFQKSPVYL